MMRKFSVAVNGKPYIVDIEEITNAADLSAQSEQVSSASVSASKQPTAHNEIAESAGAVEVSSPIPGTILKIEKAVGAVVKKGDVLLILEAMKMENEIMASADGVITKIGVTEGASVDTGEVLVVIQPQ